MSLKKLGSLTVALVTSFAAYGQSNESTSLRWLESSKKTATRESLKSSLNLQALSRHIDLSDVREVRLRNIGGHQVEVQALSRSYHRFDRYVAKLQSNGLIASVALTTAPQEGAPPPEPVSPVCPDVSTQFIVFAPNDEPTEQAVSVEVASAAEAAGLRTIRLLKADATRKNYLNYMSCPHLKGNFYDGDSDPTAFVTYDGIIEAGELSYVLPEAFHHAVTNIWLACQAYNPPMLNSMIDDLQSQKFAAGINNLHIGPSDRTGACAMKNAIAGWPMDLSFNICYQQLDIADDHWGFGGNGTDYFGY